MIDWQEKRDGGWAPWRGLMLLFVLTFNILNHRSSVAAATKFWFLMGLFQDTTPME